MEKAQKCRQTTNGFVGGWVLVLVGRWRGGGNGGEPAGEEWEEIQGGDGSLICRLPLLHESGCGDGRINKL